MNCSSHPEPEERESLLSFPYGSAREDVHSWAARTLALLDEEETKPPAPLRLGAGSVSAKPGEASTESLL
jgi:hypothetical protein